VTLKSFLATTVLAGALLYATGSVIKAANGDETLSAIVISADASESLQGAATVLADYMEQSTGTAVPVMIDGNAEYAALPENAPVIHVGPTSYVRSLSIEFGDLDDEGFVIRTVGDRHVVIVGPSDPGTVFGVYEFLERYVGVRWLMPGPDGVVVPQQRSIGVPQADIRQEPAFFSRRFSGLTTKEEGEWQRFVRMSSRIRFHHNLNKLFPPETYGSTHPEFYPLVDGQRRVPTSNGDYKWQPCFSAPGIVDEAARVICEYFDENPAALSYSLGINDVGSPGWCQCPECSAAYSGEENFIGTPDYSEPYYAWCGEVIEAVLAEHPDKWFGCLAYNNAINPPSQAQVHPRLVPYTTLDRMQWADPELRELGHGLQERWEQSASSIGWYDYIYGRQYSLPRVYFHVMAENLRYAQKHGVKAFYAEAYPNWGEGPKLYIAAKLLWNPEADVDELLQDWYVNCAGEDGAGDLASYYEHWEDFWTRRVLTSEWFGRSQYLDFHSQRYIDEVTMEEMAQCRRWLQSALDKTHTSGQRARVSRLLESLVGYESAVLYHKANTGDVPPAQMLTSFLQLQPPEPQRVQAQALLDVLEGRTQPVSRNASFETGADEPDNWMLWVKPLGDPPYGTMDWVEAPDSRTGDRCVLIEALKRGGTVQAVGASPGRYLMLVGYRLPNTLERDQLEMSVLLKDSQGRDLSFGMQPRAVHVRIRPGGWRTTARPFIVPEEVGGKAVAVVQFAAVLSNMEQGEQIYLDDVGIYRLGD